MFSESVQRLADINGLDLARNNGWLQVTRDDPRHLVLHTCNGEISIGFYLTSPDGTLLDSPSAVLYIWDEEWRVLEVSRVLGDLPRSTCYPDEIGRLNQMELRNEEEMNAFFNLWAEVLERCWLDVNDAQVTKALEPVRRTDFPLSNLNDLSSF